MRRPKGWRLPEELTSRQREVLQLWEEGLRQAEIARRLSMSRVTVHQHLRYAKAKAVKRHLESTAAPLSEPGSRQEEAAPHSATPQSEAV